MTDNNMTPIEKFMLEVLPDYTDRMQRIFEGMDDSIQLLREALKFLHDDILSKYPEEKDRPSMWGARDALQMTMSVEEAERNKT